MTPRTHTIYFYACTGRARARDLRLGPESFRQEGKDIRSIPVLHIYSHTRSHGYTRSDPWFDQS